MTRDEPRPDRGPRVIPGIPGASALGTLALTSGVALTATSGWLIVAASFRPQILTLLAAIVLVRAFGMARPALRYAERVRSHDAALGYLARRRAEVYRRLVPLTPARLGRRSRADVLAGVVDDLDDLAYAQVRVVVPLVSMIGTGLLAAALVALVLVPAALVVLSLVLSCLLLGLLTWRLEIRAQAAVVRARSRVTGLSTLLATSAPEIAAVGAAAQVEARLAAAQTELDAALRRHGVVRAIGTGVTPALTMAHAAVTALVVAPWIAHGLPTPIAALIVLVPIALGDVVALVPDAVGAAARARAADRRLTALLDQEPAVAAASEVLGPSDAFEDAVRLDPADLRAPAYGAADASDTAPAGDVHHPEAPSAAPAGIATREITAAWHPDRPALGPLDVDVPAGDLLVVTGPNGSGKSTLLAVLARHLDPRSGRYLVDERDVLEQPLEQARARIAVVDDEPHVFASTLRENLRFASPAAGDDDLCDALAVAGLPHWPDALPEGFDTILGTGGRGVSGGERARLGIARAALSQRPILLLDEPVAHLDHPTAVAVLDDLAHAARGRTVVLVTHREEAPAGATHLRLTHPSATS